MKKILSNTERRALVSCERRWNFRYMRGFVPQRNSIPLAFGQLWDAAMNSLYLWISTIEDPPTISRTLGVVGESLRLALCDGTDRWVLGELEDDFENFPEKGLLSEWVAERASELTRSESSEGWSPLGDSPSWTMADVWEQEEIFRSMLKIYFDRYLVGDIHSLKVHAVQPTLSAAIRTPSGRPSSAYSYQGVPDQVVEIDGLVYILEQKSTSMGAVFRERDLRVDPQGLSYCWLLWRAAGVPLERIGGIIYSVTRRKRPTEPRRLKCKKKPKCERCKGHGIINGTRETGPVQDCPVCKGTKQDHRDCRDCRGTGHGAVSRSDCDTTPDVFSRTVSESGGSPSDYSDILERLESRLDRWVYRFAVQVHSSEILALERELYQVSRVASVARHRSTGDSPRNVGACMVAGRQCSYVSLCRTGSSFDGTDESARGHGFSLEPDSVSHHGEPNLWSWPE